MAKTLLSIAKELIDKIKNPKDRLEIIDKDKTHKDKLVRLEAGPISIDILE
jgi:hypothetical protein